MRLYNPAAAAFPRGPGQGEASDGRPQVQTLRSAGRRGQRGGEVRVTALSTTIETTAAVSTVTVAAFPARQGPGFLSGDRACVSAVTRRHECN